MSDDRTGIPADLRVRWSLGDSIRSSWLGGIATDAAMSFVLGGLSYVVALIAPAAEGLELVVAGLVAITSFLAEVWVRWRQGPVQEYTRQFGRLHGRIKELEAENLNLKYPDALRVHIDRDLYGTISPAVDGFGYTKELRLWNFKATNRTDDPVNLTFYLHLVGEGWTPDGDWSRKKVSRRNWPESRYWTEDKDSLIGRTLALGPKGISPDGLWLVFALPDGEVADLTLRYTRMRNVLSLEAHDDITDRSAFRDFVVYLDDWPLLELMAPPSRDEGPPIRGEGEATSN